MSTPARAHPWVLRTTPAPAAVEDAGPVEPEEGPAVEAVAVSLRIVRGGERTPAGAKVRRSEALVVGEATYTLSRPARAGERVVLLNFAEALRGDPAELDEVAKATYLDGPFRAGRLEVAEHTGAAALRRVGERRDVEVTLAEGTAEVRLAYTVAVPRRYWPFGCSRRRCSLSGALAPLPSAPARGGPRLPPGRVVAPARWSVDARFASVPSWSPGQVPTDSEEAALAGDEVVVADAPVGAAGPVAYPSVFWGRRWRRARAIHAGVRIEVLHTLWRPGDQVPAERRGQLYRDVPGHALQIAREALDVARGGGIEAPPGTAMVFVQGPLRAEVAQAHPTAVVLSDQALQVLPGKRFQGFHLAAIARASFDAMTSAVFTGRHAPSTDLWLHDAVAMALLDVWRARRAQSDDYASDILRRFTFVPVVDNFLYAGQASFAQSYFRGSEDVMPLRTHPLYFSHALPTGRRIHEKLDDLLTPAQTEAFYEAVIREPGGDPAEAARRAYGYDLGWFFDQWLAPYPEVDVSVHAVTTEALPDGRLRHAITIRRAGERPAIEPVQVLAVERGGQRHYLVWNGETAAGATDHVFSLETARPLKSVTVDPRARILEVPQGRRRNVDPLFNDRSPASFRFVYTGFGLEVAASEFLAGQTPASRLQAVSGRVLFEMSRRRDLRTTGHLALHRDRESAAAIGAGVSFWFGEKINRRRLRGRVRLYNEVQSLTPRGLDQVGGVRLAQSVSLIDDNRKFNLWPDRGHRLALALHGAETFRIGEVRDHRYSLSISGSWVQIWPLAHQHTLASRLEVIVMTPLGGRPEYRNLIRAGGVDGLGAYSGNELFGRAAALAQLEYRHMYWSNFDVNLLHLFWLRGIGGTLFTGAATVSHCDDYGGWFGRESWYGQVGYGVTAFLQLLGVTPQFVRFDVAVPLVRRRTTCLGHMHPDFLAEYNGVDPATFTLPPVGVNLTFLQPF